MAIQSVTSTVNVGDCQKKTTYNNNHITTDWILIPSIATSAAALRENRYQLGRGEFMQMALFFNPEEWNPPTEDMEGSKIMMEIGTQLEQCFNEMIRYRGCTAKDIPTHIFKQIEDLVDVFYSESKAEKNAVGNLFSDHMVDEFMRTESHGSPHACSALLVLGRLVHYQCSIGGERLLDCLNRTVKAGDKLLELCQRIKERYPDQTEKVIKLSETYIYMSHCVYMQVGDRKNFAKRIRIHSEERVRLGVAPLVDHQKDDDEIWQRYRKLWTCDLPLACIHCGKFEEKGGKKHNQCGACLNALYCSKECQQVHWQHHKVDCKANSRRKKSAKRGK